MSPSRSTSTKSVRAVQDAVDRTILITGGAILLCVALLAVVLVVTAIVLCVRVRRLTDRFNDQVGNRQESAPPLNTQALDQQLSSSTQDLQGPPQHYETTKPYDSYQGLYATIPEGGQPSGNEPYAQLRGARP
ncbi:hypothetical protein LSAT2_013264 [Lamellibrachia satsuma]|nr:hypothetical protein LSAT2_013264 [Lamellibrachia satsuma]